MKATNSQYYLHRKIKQYDAVVHSQKKTIEIEEKLFRNPLPLMLTYLHKLIKLNYNIELIIMKAKKEPAKKTSTEIAIPEGIITAEVLIENFKTVKDKIPELDKSSASLKVISDDTLVVATNNMSEIMGYIKSVDTVRTALKKPYLDAGRMIDQYCKGIDDMLQRFKVRLGTEITNWKTIKEAEERQKQQLRLKELEKLESEKREESDLLVRIEKQLNARLYGGVYYTKAGDRKSSAGCVRSEDCISLHKVLNESIPKIDSFIHFPERYEDMIAKLAKRISEHQTNLIAVEGILDYERKVALERIAQARADAEVESLENEESITKQITKEIRHEEVKTEKAVSAAGKGIRQDLRYNIQDEKLIPRDFFSVDHDKVKKYMHDNKEKIKEALQKNEETIPGIKFFMQDTFISR